MLESARKLAQIFLWKALNGPNPVPLDLDSWFAKERTQNPQRFFPYLIENPGKIETVFVITPSATDENLAILETVSIDQFGPQPSEKLPFNMPSGSQSAALGPIFKRSYAKDKGAGPSDKIVNTTINSFREIGNSDLPWANYFKEICLILRRPRIQIGDQVFEADQDTSILHLAIQKISANKTVFLTVKDPQARYPGEVREYVQYLQTILPESKYTSLKTPKQPDQTCPLCFKQNVTVYPSACSGAGMNVGNVDRDGAFPGLDPSAAYQGYALCLDCADLLYVFKFYVLNGLHIYVAGAKAGLIPNLSAIVSEDLDILMDSIKEDRINQKHNPTEVRINQEETILDFLLAKRVIASFDIIWADFGQKMENIRGMITDVFPSKLRSLKKKNDEFSASIGQYPFAPAHWHDDAKFTLDLQIVSTLFKRPGGKSAESANNAASLKGFKNELVANIYKQTKMSPNRIWAEAEIVIEWYLKEVLKSDDLVFRLTREGYSERKNTVWLTLAGWVRHFAVFLEYLYKLEVLEQMDNKRTYIPKWDRLQPYFEPGSAINTNEKAFAFVIGFYFGILLQVQENRGVNVATNALSWIRKPNFSGLDLQELFQKSWSKIQDYTAAGELEKRENYNKKKLLERLFEEIGRIGMITDETKLSTLNSSACRYHLVLGIALTNDLMYKKEEN